MALPQRSWRWLVTDRASVSLTLLDRLASSQTANYVLNDAATAEGHVPAASPEINRPADDGDPFLAINNRLLFGFRKEVESVPSYAVRFGGIIMQVEDEGQANNATTHYTAYDPWQLLRSRPIRFGADKSYRQPVNGLQYRNVRGDLIVKSLLANTSVEDGTAHIDYGQTGYFEGVIEATDDMTISFEQGTSVGDAWTKCVSLGIDIVLTPVYDPLNRPGIVAELNVYQLAGAAKPSAIFSWDRFGRSLVGASRLRDGTQMANKIVYFPQQGDGGGAIYPSGTSASETKYGRYWLERFVQGESIAAVAAAFGQVDFERLKNGKETITIDPAPERSPDPFTEYFLGDTVPINASDRLREPLITTKRVFGIPIDISDNGTESVSKLLVTSPDA